MLIHSKKNELSMLNYRILSVLAVLHKEFISSASLSVLVERLRIMYKQRIFRSNVRRSLHRMRQCGQVSYSVKKGTPVDIMLTVSGYSRMGSDMKIFDNREMYNVVNSSFISLPVVTGTYLMRDREVTLNGEKYRANRADFLIHQDGTTCLKLSNSSGVAWFFNGWPVAVASR